VGNQNHDKEPGLKSDRVLYIHSSMIQIYNAYMANDQLAQPQQTNKLAITSLFLGASATWAYLFWPVLAAIGRLLDPYPGFLETLNILVIYFGVIWLRGMPFIIAFLASLAGLATGILSLVQIKKNRQTGGGGWMAIAGMSFAALGIIFGVLLIAYLAFLWWGLSNYNGPL
jgi:hypothetical protein